MEDDVADITAPPMEAAASSSNSELPAILMILPNNHRLLQSCTHPATPEDVRNLPKLYAKEQ
jgi:hypothetical protein